MNVLDILFPPLCYSCRAYLKKDEKELSVCAKCISSIQVWNGLFCPVCKSRIPPQRGSRTSLHPYVPSSPSCHPESKFILTACSDYGNPAAKELIHTFKYKKIENAIYPITELLIKPYIASLASSFQLIEKNKEPNKLTKLKAISCVIVPIPLHASKKRTRGFNQSELIARSLAQSLGVSHPEIGKSDVPNIEKMYSREAREDIGLPRIETDILKRTKPTEPQAETKNAAEREKNVRGCFSINPELVEGLPYKNIILVDDVYTSGATMAEAVRVLKDAGAKRILAFVLAKA